MQELTTRIVRMMAAIPGFDRHLHRRLFRNIRRCVYRLHIGFLCLAGNVPLRHSSIRYSNCIVCPSDQPIPFLLRHSIRRHKFAHERKVPITGFHFRDTTFLTCVLNFRKDPLCGLRIQLLRDLNGETSYMDASSIGGITSYRRISRTSARTLLYARIHFITSRFFSSSVTPSRLQASSVICTN